jgi:MFS transporter, FSR family, fosmidomycin resistance protein
MEKRSAVVLRNTGHGVNDLYWFILPSLLPLILDQFDMKYGAAGGLLTAFLGVIAVFSFILGRLSDRFSRPKMLGLGFLVTSVFLICASLAEGFGLFVFFLLLAGIGVSSYHPTVYAFIDETTTSRRGRKYGMFEFWGSMALFIMFFVHGLLLRKMNWKTIMLVTSLPGLAVGLLYLSHARNLPSLPSVKGETGSIGARSGNASPLRFALFLIAVAVRYFGIIGVVNFTPTYLVREVGLQKSIASFATGIYFLGGLIFTPFTGRLCDRKSPFLVLLAATVAAFPLILLLSATRSLWLFPLSLLLLGGAYYGAGPAMNMITARMGDGMGKGEAFGWFMAVTAVTYSFSPLLFGMNADRVGLRMSMRLFSYPLVLSSAVLLALYLIVRPRPTSSCSPRSFRSHSRRS